MIGIAHVGCGSWGPNLIRNVAAHPEAELVALCDSDPVALERVAGKYPGAAQFSSLSDVLVQPAVEAVIIATPSGLHYEHASAALRSGKHVLVEKPMASSVEQAIDLIRASEDAGRILMVGHTFLYNNIVQAVKRTIDAGELGEILYAYSQRLNLGEFRCDSDVLWTLAPHDLSILNYWFEARPYEVSARGLSFIRRESGIAEVCFAHSTYPGGLSAHLHMSWLDPQKSRRMVVVGSDKMLVYDEMNIDAHIQIFDKRAEREYRHPTDDFAEFTTRLRAGDLTIPNIRLIEPLGVEIGHFIDCIRKGVSPVSDGHHGLEVIAILESLTRSMQADGRPIQVDYPECSVDAAASARRAPYGEPAGS